MTRPSPILPAYGTGSLAEVAPSLLAALGADLPNPLAVPPARAIALLVVDGLGWELLCEHRAVAPFLSTHLDTARSLTSGYPSSTATSLAMLSTGRPPIAHGLTGYTMAAPGLGRAMNNLAWATHGQAPRDLRELLPPERLQPHPTLPQLAAAHGVRSLAVGPAEHAASGLTRAILRGGPFAGVGSLDAPDATAAIETALSTPGPSLVYAYDPSVDGAGHRHGPGSPPWLDALRGIDRVATRLADALPPDGLLAVTADHGMVDLTGPDAQRIDIAERGDLRAGVRFLAGEARARHVHVETWEPARAVLTRWRAALGDLAWVLSRDEAIDAGWFGTPSELDNPVRERIGDVVCAAAGPVGVFQARVDPGEASLAGHHGSLTAAEVLVPWIVIPAARAS